MEIRLECARPEFFFPHLKLLCLLSKSPTLCFDTQQRNSFLIKYGVFYNKNKILTKLFIVKNEKITLLWTVFSVVRAHKQQVFACSNEKKTKLQSVHALVLSLWMCYYLLINVIGDWRERLNTVYLFTKIALWRKRCCQD